MQGAIPQGFMLRLNRTPNGFGVGERVGLAIGSGYYEYNY